MNERSTATLQTLLTVLPVLSAGLYVMGTAYHESYLSTFGLNDSFFPLAPDRSLLFGFLALITVGLVPLLTTLLAGFALSFAVLITAVLSSTPKVKFWQSLVLARLAKYKLKIAPSKLLVDAVDAIATAFIYFAGIILAILLLIIVAVLSGKSGREQASKEIDSFRNHKDNYTFLYTPLLSSPTRTKQIICNQSHCAFWLGNQALVIRHESVERMVMHNPSLPVPATDKALSLAKH